MESEITADEKAAIIDKFIRYTPSGELELVIDDLNCLLGDKSSEFQHNPMLKSSARHRRDQLFPVTVPGCEQKCLITNYNCLDNDKYYDPRSKQSFSFDPITGKGFDFQDESDSVLSTQGILRVPLDKAISAYVKTRYPNGNSSVFVIDPKSVYRRQSDRYGSSNDWTACSELVNTLSSEDLPINRKTSPCYAICIECHDYQWQNFWTGSWRSQWIVSTANHPHYIILGLVKVQVHYYEDSNIQLRGQKKFKVQIDTSSSGDPVSEIVKAISSTEDAYQLSINECQAKMSEQIFKSLRRQLPVTKSKINWDVMVSYRDMRELNTIDQHNDSRS